MSSYVIYIDQVILGSIIMNYIILLAVSKISGVTVPRWRLACAAILGGVYSIIAFVPVLSGFLTFWSKLLVSLVMVFIAFFPQSYVKLVNCLLFFYLVSFSLGGSILGFMYFFEFNGGINSIPVSFPNVIEKNFWYSTFVALIVFWVGTRSTAVLFKRRYTQTSFKIEVRVKLEETNAYLKGLVDSGNQLRDPLTGNPVLIVQYNAIENLLPGELIEYMDKSNNFNAVEIMEKIKETRLESRFRLIPFRSLGEDSGMLLGFNPDEIELIKDNDKTILEKVTVAIYGKELSSDSEYNALVHPELVDSLAS